MIFAHKRLLSWSAFVFVGLLATQQVLKKYNRLVEPINK